MAKRAPLAKLVWWLVAFGALIFALQGGEYTTADLLRQYRAQQRLERQVDSLQALNDSLEKYLAAVRTDPATQERIAREEFGMVRGEREILYRFAEVRDPRAKD